MILEEEKPGISEIETLSQKDEEKLSLPQQHL
jgi:hypothetical protein